MADWKRSDDADIVIAHLSDLHIGSDSCNEVEPVVREFVKNDVRPDLVLVTGDIADTTDDKHYERAREFLDNLSVAHYFICPGNHDRYPKGNRIWRWFRGKSSAIDQKFAMRVLAPDVARTVDLGRGKFTVGLLGFDSCEKVDFFARGFVPHEQMQQLGTTLERDGKDWDLSVVLVHHHPQPVRALETARKGKLSDLGAVTSLVNAGNLLEKLAKSNVDLVLHGHEHAANWGRYGTLEGTQGEVRVLGAGSAFGNSSLGGCSVSRATFNIVTIRPNRAAFAEVVAYDGNSWIVREKLHLFDAATSRRLRLLRNAGKRLDADVDSHVTKYVEFTSSRDIEIRWVLTNWFLAQTEFRHPVSNSTGIPMEGIVTIGSEETGTERISGDFVRKGSGDDHSWIFQASLPDRLIRRRCRLTFSYRWRSGALLTSSEMRVAREGNAPGILRDQGLEFASVYAPGVMASAQLIVTIPADYVPSSGVEVRVFENNHEQTDESTELRSRVLTLGPGRYALSVPYPRQNWWYALTWKPGNPPAPTDTFGVLDRLRHQGPAVLRAARAEMPSAIASNVSMAAYVLDSGDQIARCIAFDLPDSRLTPPDQVLVRGDASALGQGFWGVPVAWKRPDNQRAAAELGFLADEELLCVVPLRFSFRSDAAAPFAVLRLGFPPGVDVTVTKPDELEKAFGHAILRMLTWRPPTDNL